MLQFLRHLKFFLSATDQHGVHSPFIYNYLTKCLYAKPDYCQEKSWNILLKSIAYFGANRIGILDGTEKLQKKIQDEFPAIQWDKGSYDILFMPPFEAYKVIRSISLENEIHNNTLLLIDNIHSNRNNLSLWTTLKKHPKVTVTVDLFYCGAVFFRKEQAEEHFKIRI